MRATTGVLHPNLSTKDLVRSPASAARAASSTPLAYGPNQLAGSRPCPSWTTDSTVRRNAKKEAAVAPNDVDVGVADLAMVAQVAAIQQPKPARKRAVKIAQQHAQAPPSSAIGATGPGSAAQQASAEDYLAAASAPVTDAKPKRGRRTRRALQHAEHTAADASPTASTDEGDPAPTAVPTRSASSEPAAPQKPQRRRRRSKSEIATADVTALDPAGAFTAALSERVTTVNTTGEGDRGGSVATPGPAPSESFSSVGSPKAAPLASADEAVNAEFGDASSLLVLQGGRGPLSLPSRSVDQPAAATALASAFGASAAAADLAPPPSGAVVAVHALLGKELEGVSGNAAGNGHAPSAAAPLAAAGGAKTAQEELPVPGDHPQQHHYHYDDRANGSSTDEEPSEDLLSLPSALGHPPSNVPVAAENGVQAAQPVGTAPPAEPCASTPAPSHDEPKGAPALAAPAPMELQSQESEPLQVALVLSSSPPDTDGAPGTADNIPGISSSAEVAPGADSDGEGEGDGEELDDTAVAISLLAAAAAAAANAPPVPPSEYPEAVPRVALYRRTGTWEPRPVLSRPAVVLFQGSSLRELQTLVTAVRGPTIIDLQGRVITLREGEKEEAEGRGAGGGEGGGTGGTGRAAPPAAAGTRPAAAGTTLPSSSSASSTSLVLARELQVPGWSSVSEALSERARMVRGGGGGGAAGEDSLSTQSPRPPPASAAPQQSARRQAALAASWFGGGAGGADINPGRNSCLVLHNNDLTLANGTLQLHRGCRVVVSGRRVALRRVEVVDAEASGWWRQANAMPATCLQSSALITVSDDDVALPAAARRLPPPPQPPHRRHAAAAGAVWSSIGRSAGRAGSGDGGPSLDLDECRVLAGGRDRDLVRVDGSGASLTARYCRLQGGANAVVTTLGSSLHLDCCVVEGYATAGVVAMESSVRAVGSRLLGAAGSLIGLQAVASSHVTALGCFFRGHASNVEVMTSASVDMQGCVLSRPDCRYGLTLHPSFDAPSSSPSPHAPGAPGAAAAASGCRVRLSDCELGHAVQVGGGELELERCTFALNPTPADAAAATAVRTTITCSPELAALLAAAIAATSSRSGTGGAGAGAALAGSVAAVGSLRLVGCRVGDGGEGEAVVVEAAREAQIHLSASPGVWIRREGAGQ